MCVDLVNQTSQDNQIIHLGAALLFVPGVTV